ncbi:MAG: glycosyltransferase family 4 protein, partial [Proteobacteria bacterium]|nr:glycosyltransferase family 4 protein [Pseudomonadota bacterium]
KYKYVVFWQNLPKKSLWKLHHKRMYWFPMRDGLIPRNDRRWRRWAKKFKIINFCKDLYDKQSALGIRSLYVRYFPDPREFIPGDPNKVFFWQRLANIDIGNVAKVLPPDGNLSVHLHKALDPNQPFVPPDADAEKKFSITYSEWFPNKSDMTDLIKRAGIYVAPRWMEGIGMSFLEAMAMGKAIIAQDAPTMNEYIENGINGYLVDFGNPEPVDLSDIEWVQKNAHESAQIGYKRWLNDQKKIIKFIKGIK